MKKILTTLFAIFILSSTLFAQTPKGFNYQAVVRNTAGQLVNNRNVSVRLSIIRENGSMPDVTIYQQTNQVTTNANGLFTLVVGENSNEFAGINWSNGPYFLKSEVDPDGGTNYTLSTSQKILAVPYAFVAERAAVADGLSGNFVYNETDPRFVAWNFLYDSLRNAPDRLSQFYNDMNFLTPDDIHLYLNGDTLSITGGSYVILPMGGNTYAGQISWDSIIGRPTNLSQFFNDLTISWDSITDRPTNLSQFFNDITIEWDSIINHPTNLSQFNNDLGFITEETQGLSDVIAINNSANGQIKNVYAPTDPYDAANKAYVDSSLASEVQILNNRIDSLNNVYENRMDSLNNRIYELEHPHVPGALSGIFSVSANTKINFSQGNLQYRPRVKTWRFAANQYDIAGSENNNVFMQSYCSSWIDLFGYGTSGWDGGAGRFMPYETTTNDGEYTENTDGDDLTGFYANADWGYYNPIINGGNQMGMWRTLTYSEWNYLLTLRPNAAQLKGLATVNSVPGFVVLPDTWSCPAGMTFVNTDTSYTTNVYSSSDWATMEAAGAVFLPAAGSRISSTTANIGTLGNYWTSSHVNGTTGYAFHVAPSANVMLNNVNYSTGCSVRLVREY